MSKLIEGKVFLAMVKEQLAGPIEKYALNIRKDVGPWVELANGHCRLRLTAYEPGRVRSYFSNPNIHGGREYELGFFLHVTQGVRVKFLLPPMEPFRYPEKAIVGELQRIGKVLEKGCLCAPLEGDYAWEPRYMKSETECLLLLDVLDALNESNMGKLKRQEVAIRRKQATRDFDWIAEAKATIAGRPEYKGLADLSRLLGELRSKVSPMKTP
jgi:hypothetical protein